jgi:hypothetical protein
MSIFLITWDLNKEKPNYDQARQKLLSYLSRYDHIKDTGLDSVWFVSSSDSAEVVDLGVRANMDSNGRLVVIELLVGHYAGWLSANVCSWIHERL